MKQFFSRLSSDHFDAQVFPRSLVDVVGDGDGGGYLAEVGHDTAVQPLQTLVAKRVAKQTNHLCLLIRQTEVETG